MSRPDLEGRRSLLELAYQQAGEAGDVIEDLLIASRAERGVLDALPEVVDLVPLTETVIRRTSVGARELSPTSARHGVGHRRHSSLPADRP